MKLAVFIPQTIMHRMKSEIPIVLKFKSVKKSDWDRREEAEGAIRDLVSLGYKQLGVMEAKPMVFVKVLAFASAKNNTYALVHDDAQEVWVDLISVTSKGDFHSATSALAPMIGLVAQRPTYCVSDKWPDVPVAILHEEFLKGRPKKPWSKPTAKGLIGAYQIVCEADIQWQKDNVNSKNAMRIMNKMVSAARVRAIPLKQRDPVEELLAILKNLALTKEMNPQPPQTLTGAAIDGNLGAVKLFLKQGDDIHEETGLGSPLAAAAQGGHLKIIDYLLSQGADPKLEKQMAMFSAIAKAVHRGHFKIVERLLKFGIPAEQKKAAIAGAKDNGHDNILQLLEGKPVLAASKPSKTKDFSLRESWEEFRLIAGKEPEENPIKTDADRVAAITRALVLMQMPEVHSKKNLRHRGRNSYLNLAAETGNLKLVEAVLEMKLEKELLSDGLISAASIGQRDIVDCLLAAGADAKFANKGYTALTGASAWGDLGIVQALLKAGANPEARTEGGETPMTVASGPCRKKIEAALQATVKTSPKTLLSCIQMQGNTKANIAKALGVEEFKEAMGQPEWSIIFIEAGPETVAKAFAKLHPEAKWHMNVLHTKLEAEPPLILIFRLQNHLWTILLRTVGWLEMEDINQLPIDAKALSSALKTRTLTYMAEDTSGCEGYEIFENGKSIEEAMSGDALKFRSSWRKQPKFGDNFPDPTFSELKIYLPACRMDNDGYQTKLLTEGIPSEVVERLDCFELK